MKRKLPSLSSLIAPFRRFKKRTNSSSAAAKSKRRIVLNWRKIARGFLLLCMAGIIIAIALFAWYFKDLPQPGELRARTASESTILYDRNGKQIYDISGEERRILIKNEEIPDVIKKATVAIEDKNFYHHHGLDFKGLIRGAVLRPLTGKSAQGGSTITQQYIKNAILSPKRSLTRKIKELILALEIEAIYSKEDILALYLNEIPYGSNIYGVEAASQAYFGKSAKEKGLTLAEAATLAAIPQAPTRYSPYGSHIDLLMRRKNLVLDDMAKTGAITQEQANQAKKETPLAAKDFAQKRDNFPAPHFVMYVREQLVQKYGEEMVQRGGLRVTTTIDLDKQKLADDAVKEQAAKTFPRAGASNAGLVAVDPKNGQVIAMVGSVDYFDRENEGNFNVTTAERQPGSSIKPLVYATLFKGKWSPGSLIWDVQTDFNNYKPNNYDNKFHGPLTIRKSLGNSFNIPAVKALSLAGIKSFLNTTKDLGLTTLDAKDAGLAYALGAGEVKPIEMAGAYAAFANNGAFNPVVSILKIQDSRGRTLHEWKPNPKQVLAPEIAYEISSMLSDIEAKRPTFNLSMGILTLNGKTVASKTGTSNNYKDAWTVGYTPSLVTAVWAGNNNGKEMNRAGGSVAAAPIWHQFMQNALKDTGNEPFYRPEGIVDATIDFLSGKKPTSASGQLITDIFASWQLPDSNDDVHQIVKVCRSTGQRATDQTPSEEIEERSFTRVRSERPDVAAWENPVQAWANSNGINQSIPTEQCTITNSNPKITITNPATNSEVSDIFSVAADISLPPGTTGTVDFSVDGKLINSDDSDPYTATIDASTLKSGLHQISATVRASNGNNATDTINVMVGELSDSNPPGNVSNVTAAPGPASGTVLVSWKNPNDRDLASISFFVSLTPGSRGTKVSTQSATPNNSQATTLSGLTSRRINYITIVTTDTNENSSTPTQQYTVTPL